MYTIKDISKLTGKHEESVRRWIRNGWLKADNNYHKKTKGATLFISEDNFKKFCTSGYVKLPQSLIDKFMTYEPQEFYTTTEKIIRLQLICSFIESLEHEKQSLLSELRGER